MSTTTSETTPLYEDLDDFSGIYLDQIRKLQDKRYGGLIEYMESAGPIAEHMNSRVVIADYAREDFTNPHIESTGNPIELLTLLKSRPLSAHGRLILMSSTSGLDEDDIVRQLQGSWKTTRNVSPFKTDPRLAPWVHKGQIRGHVTNSTDASIVACVAACTWIDPEILLRFLHPHHHLAYQSYSAHCLAPGLGSGWDGSWRSLQIGLDQDNHLVAAVSQKSEASPWTMLIMIAEDNCLGIDLNPHSNSQPFLASAESPSQVFTKKLPELNHMKNKGKISGRQPLSFIPLYSTAVIAAFAAQLELYRRHWQLIYEPWANTSVVYGYSEHRNAVRGLAGRYATHIRYINHTIDDIDRTLTFSEDHVRVKTELEFVKHDFEHFRREIGTLKAQCDQFLEQQVGKLALQDSRTQMRDARDVQRITYLAFVFVPLSLVSSFFGMNVKELDSGSTPVWVFVVTAIAFLLVSLLVIWLARAIPRWWQIVHGSFLVKYTEGEDWDKLLPELYWMQAQTDDEKRKAKKSQWPSGEYC